LIARFNSSSWWSI